MNKKYIILIIILTIILIYYICINSIPNYYKVNNMKTEKYEQYKDNLPIHEKPPFPIDIVYTWSGEKKSKDNRISNNNELKYSLRSIIEFAPWFNRIFILMNPPKKIPSWFNEKYSKIITLVDHTETFPDKKHLPTTNSNSIETTLSNIPNLSEHFIYFNDDVFLGRRVSYLEFFNEQGKAVIPKSVLLHTDLSKSINKKIKIPKMVERCHPHIPKPLLKSEIIKFNNEYKDFIEWIKTSKNRQQTYKECKKNNLFKFGTQIFYPLHIFMLENNKVIIRDYEKLDNFFTFFLLSPLVRDFFSFSPHQLNKKLKKNPKIFNINDLPDSIIYNRQKQIKKMNKILEKYYKNKPFFEK